MKVSSIIVIALLASLVAAEVYFSENFEEGWEKRWVESGNKKAEGTAGVWKWTAGEFAADESNKGIQTSKDASFYQLSAKFPEFSNKGKDLVVQFSVKFEKPIECGGGYIKILPPGLDQEKFEGESAYNIMFGPDVCGFTKRVHVIFNYKGTNHLIKKTIAPKTDTNTHTYTLIVKPDQTYAVLIDNEKVEGGSLLEDWDFLPPKDIKDPSISKPADWVDDKEIPDPTAVKPEGWDSIPELIADPEATKPEDWDDELDGEWEAPLVVNPDYQGEWEAPMIPNPAYKGEWVHPLIPNPAYAPDDSIYAYTHSFIGIEVWQVRSGSIFDNFLITDDVKAASAAADAINKAREAEKQAEEAARAEKEAEAARLAALENAEEEEEEVHEHDEL